MFLPKGYLSLSDRLNAWLSAAPDAAIVEYKRALPPFLERTRKARRAASVALLSAAVAGAARLTGAAASGPVSVVNLLTTGALASALPVAYGLALRSWLGAHVAHDLASATFRMLLRRGDGNATGLELHAPLLPPASLGAGDLLRWGLGNDASGWQTWTLRGEVAAGVVALLVLVVGGPTLCVAAALRAPEPWGFIGSALGVLLALTALRPLEAELGVMPEERVRP